MCKQCDHVSACAGNLRKHIRSCIFAKVAEEPRATAMSRRASVFARQNPGKRRVRFPDEVVFEESIKESDGMAIMALLRRASVDIDVNRINMAGMTALHQVRCNICCNRSVCC